MLDGSWLRRKEQLLRAHVWVLAAARGPTERADVLRFIARQGTRMAGREVAGDAEVRFRGLTYVVDQSVELHTLVELHRDSYYSRVPGFLPTSGTTVVDIGANVGVFTMYHAAAGANVLAVEPNPAAHRRLCRALSVNGLDRHVTTVNAAVGAADGHGRLHLPQGLSVLGSIVPGEPDASPAADDIPILTLDHLVRRHKVERIDLLKVDVEGAEADVFRGADGALTNVRRVILEYHTTALLGQVRDLLADAGLHEVLTFPASEPGIGMLYAAREDPIHACSAGQTRQPTTPDQPPAT